MNQKSDFMAFFDEVQSMSEQDREEALNRYRQQESEKAIQQASPEHMLELRLTQAKCERISRRNTPQNAMIILAHQMHQNVFLLTSYLRALTIEVELFASKTQGDL